MDLHAAGMTLLFLLLPVARGMVVAIAILWAGYQIGARVSKRFDWRPGNGEKPERCQVRHMGHMWRLAHHAEPVFIKMLHRTCRVGGLMVAAFVLIYVQWGMGWYEPGPGLWTNMWHYASLPTAPVAAGVGVWDAWRTLQTTAAIGERELGRLEVAKWHAQADAEHLDASTPASAPAAGKPRRL